MKTKSQKEPKKTTKTNKASSNHQSTPQNGNSKIKKKSGQKSHTILLVEDDPVLSRMYSEKFKNEGFNVIHAADGQTALKFAQEKDYDIILLDVMLPKLSGIDMLERLRTTPKGKNIPVVTLTNLAEKEEQERAIRLGVKEYLIKAMHTPEKVIAVLKKYINGKLQS